MKMNSNLASISLIIVLGAAASFSAQAQNGASPLSSIYACSAIADDMARLACFDKNVPAIKVKEEQKEIVTIDANDAEEIRRDSFGFSMPSLPKLGIFKSKDGKADKTPQLFPVKSASKGRDGLRVVMENGQVWQQTTGEAGYIPKGTLTAKIKPASMGSFRLTLIDKNGKTGRKGIRVKRVE